MPVAAPIPPSAVISPVTTAAPCWPQSLSRCDSGEPPPPQQQPPPPQEAVASAPARLRFADKIGTLVPPAWVAGKDYVSGVVRVGDLVVVARSDGTVRFGEVLASAGAPGDKAFEICVTVDREGRPDTVRVELGASVFRPAVAGAAGAAEAALGLWEQLEAAIAAAIRVSSAQ